ncbi:MAG: CvpA family protein [Lachnospiraceae bacterium]|nr:CvpA family protein [Lachnospiraceae bacterium]
MNLTLIVVLLLTIYMMIKGYRKGFTKELSGLVALIAAFFVLALAIMLFSSFSQGEVTNTVYSVILLVLSGAVYGVIKLLLRSAKAITTLPFLHFLDQLLGVAAGFGKSVLIVWILFLLCANNYLGTITEYIRADIAGSAILKLLYQYNFFIS